MRESGRSLGSSTFDSQKPSLLCSFCSRCRHVVLGRDLDLERQSSHKGSMNSIESSILSELENLDRAVKSMSTANPKPNLIPIFEELDRLLEGLGPDGDPQLKHFLEGKSYQKAMLYLSRRR